MMLIKLQRRTLVISQIVGYTITLFIGVIIICTTTQLYIDFKPLLHQESGVFEHNSAVISKTISMFKSIDKDKIYFTEQEIDELKKQSFTNSVSKFTSASFEINAYTKQSNDIPIFYTDLFFESIPDKYLDVKTEEWKWDPNVDFIPIIIPENYLNLYNFGFAESQGLPVLSKNTISQIEFNVKISGNFKRKNYKSKIVGFSNTINSILVPEDFLLWANKEYGGVSVNKTSRVLIEFKNPSDKGILKYFNDHNYAINKEKLKFSKIVFFFNSAIVFVLLISIIIIILSIAYIVLCIHLILNKNQELLLNLYNIGYHYKKIVSFYKILISSTTVITIILAIICSVLIRNYYIEKFKIYFDYTPNMNICIPLGILISILLVFIYNVLIIKSIKKIVLPVKNIH